MPLRPYFLPLRETIAPNFRYYELVSITDKNKEFDKPLIKLVYIENSKFSPPFYNIARFYEIRSSAERSAKEKTSKIAFP